ncbi:MAG: acetylxylan esterase [Thermoproteales archaeon]|nr:acetylxylan esterase [Thermoproteales archaeon]
MHNFEPTKYFKFLYKNKERIYSFKVESIEEWREWRKEFRKILIELLGEFDYPETPLNPVKIEEKEYDYYIREKIIYSTDEFSDVPAYVLRPKKIYGRLPAVLALHGHGYGKDEITGIWDDGTERKKPISRGYQKDFALELVKRNMIVIAPDQAGFGERREKKDKSRGPGRSSCWQLSTWALLYGKTTLGKRVWDALRTVDYLINRNDVDSERIGIMGISGGGTVTTFSAAIDDRIKAVVISGYLNTFKDSILSIDHCIDNYIPGILKYAEMYDVACLIAPRPLLIEHGTKDPIFPFKATLRAFNVLKKAYSLFNAEHLLESDFFEGKHEISGRKSYDFLKKWLYSDIILKISEIK